MLKARSMHLEKLKKKLYRSNSGQTAERRRYELGTSEKKSTVAATTPTCLKR